MGKRIDSRGNETTRKVAKESIPDVKKPTLPVVGSKVPCATCKKMVKGRFTGGELFCAVCGMLLHSNELKKTPLAEKLKESKATPPRTAEPEKSSKSVGWRWVQDGPRPAFAILRIGNGDSADYLFQRITSEEFRLTKLEEDRATSYTVSIGAIKRCGCEGFRRHQKCKHVDALVSLRKESKL